MLLLTGLAPHSVINQLILVEQVQRRATRFITGRDRDLCYKDRLIKLNLLALNYWLEYLDLVFFERRCNFCPTFFFICFLSKRVHSPKNL